MTDVLTMKIIGVFGLLSAIFLAGYYAYYLAYCFFDGMLDFSKRREQKQLLIETERRRQGEIALAAYALKAQMLGLTCGRCGNLAMPIPSTRNRYRCSCGYQFASDPHDMTIA